MRVRTIVICIGLVGCKEKPMNMVEISTPDHQKSSEIVVRPKVVKNNNLAQLIKALEIVESNCDLNAIGDNGKAVGCLQIWPIMVKDCNRILGRNEFSLVDRYTREQSYRMCRIYLANYCTANRLGHEPNNQDYARCWNGGPNGYKKESTVKYWLKVKEILK